MISLEVMNLSHNHLGGEIPQGKQFNTISNDSYKGNLGLCGVPLVMKCSNDPEQHSPPSENLWRDERFGFGWKRVAIGYGCGMIFGVGLGCSVLFIGKPKWHVTDCSDNDTGLNLSHNRLSGPIPQSMGNLTNLESLDLSSNMLTGRIPAELVNLNSLEVLNLSYNRLVGEIPQGRQFNSFLNDSYEGNLGLCGVPLSMKCINQSKNHSPPSENLWREERFGFGWEPMAIGYGCGMVFGVGIGSCVFLTRKPQWLIRMVERLT